MKKFFIIIPVVAACFFISCNTKKETSSTTTSDKTQKNLAASHVVSSAFGSGDVSGIDAVVASDFVDHTEKGDMGRDSLKAMITMMHSMNKDMKMETVKEFADDDYTFSWMRYTGTSDGSMGMPKGPYDMTAIEVVKFKDGLAIEHWGYMEPREMMKMMGQQPAMDDHKMDNNKMDKDKMDNKMDTAKKMDNKM